MWPLFSSNHRKLWCSELAVQAGDMDAAVQPVPQHLHLPSGGGRTARHVRLPALALLLVYAACTSTLRIRMHVADPFSIAAGASTASASSLRRPAPTQPSQRRSLRQQRRQSLQPMRFSCRHPSTQPRPLRSPHTGLPLLLVCALGWYCVKEPLCMQCALM